MSSGVALVVGGAGAIGGAIADGLARAGYAVTVTGTCADELARSPNALPGVVLDVTDAAAVADCVCAFERLDVLVNAAGVTFRDDQEFEPEIFARVLDINLTGVMRACYAARPLLTASGGGSIVNIASMLSYFGGPEVPAYASSKGGIVQFTRSLAGAWAADGIRVNAVAPGYIVTALTRAIYEEPVRREQIIQRTPLGRWGRPEDLVGAVVFLCSAPASFITGTVLPVDGGYSIV